MRKNEDNTIVISNTTSGESIANAGLLICNMGGVDAVLSKCEGSDIPVEEVRKQAYIRRLHSEQSQKVRMADKAEEERKSATDNYNRLLEQCGGEVSVTYDNLKNRDALPCHAELGLVGTSENVRPIRCPSVRLRRKNGSNHCSGRAFN